MKNPYSYLLLNRISIRLSKIVAKSFFLFICYFMFSAQVFAQQQKNVTGTVIDSSGEPIIGASVTVVGQKTGTVTDLDGKFVLSVAPQGALQISYLGYVTQTVPVNDRTVISVTLAEDTEKLDEVVVIGYGTVKKRDLTGAVSSMKSEDITIAPTTNVMEALQGKISGMDIQKTTGQVGEGVKILLRGNRSIYGDNNPLFVIDGIISSGETYAQLNPSDIESVDVLKDASSTAIYGSAGANGVIMITTKRGKDGKASVNFDAYVGFSGKPEFFHGMTGGEWTRYQREAYKFINGQYPADMSSVLTDADKLAAYNSGKWIDWVDEATGNTAVNQKYNVSVTAGTAKTKIFSSLGYDREEGLLQNENRNRYAIRLNIDQEIFSWMKAGFASNLTYSIKNSGVKNTFTKSISAFPLGEAYDKKGDINYEYATKEYTPLGDFIKDQFVDNTRNTYFNGNAYLELTPVKGFVFRTLISGTLNNSRRGQFWGAEATANRPSYAGTPHAAVNNSYGYSYMWDNILTYSTTLNINHDVSATLLSSWTMNENENNLAAGSGQLLNSWSFYRLLGATAPYVESDYTRTQKMSYAVRLNYAYKGKYLLTFSNRWDGVSWLADGHKWDAFPAGAIAWRISDEPFMEDTQSWLSNLKLRAGYGVTGNSGGVEAYGSVQKLQPYSSNGISLGGNRVPFIQYVGSAANKNLGWEKSYNTNIGLDFGLLNGRIDASFEWFTTTTKDLLYKRTVLVTSGLTAWGSPITRWENLAKTSNQGVELTINSRNVRTKDFTWNSSLTFTWNTEKIVSLPTGDLIAEKLFEGQPIKSHYDYKYAGIWGANTPADILAAYGVKPGYVKAETTPLIDANGISDKGVHKYSDKDKQILGHENPDYIIGLSNTFKYRDFDLTVFAMARYGQTIKSDLLGWYNGKTGSNNQISGVDYWTESNQNAYYPAAGSGTIDGNSKIMPALQYRDGSFIKVKNITLGYTLPRNISRTALMEKCRFYFTAYNPFLYVKDKQLKGTDPENNGADGFPLYKQFVFGVNLTF